MPAMPAASSTTPVAEPPPTAANDEARRLAAQKRREKAAHDKADRDAKALADQHAAAARAAQDAALRRAEEAQRARQVTVAPPVAAVPTPPKPRGVREICAGRGLIAESICQSRECGAPEHAGEALCKQVKEAEDRRGNLQN
jgi:hypothetical protein